MFARSDDVNLAYQAANPLVNFQPPDQSTLVTARSPAATTAGSPTRARARDTMLTWIKNWIGARLRLGHARSR